MLTTLFESIQHIPALGALLAFLGTIVAMNVNGFKEKREGKREGRRKAIEEFDEQVAQRTAEIMEQDENDQAIIDSVRTRTGSYDDERVPDGGARARDIYYRDE